MAGFVADRGVGQFSHIPDVDLMVWRQFGVVQQRTYVLINDDGTWNRTGYGNLEADVQALIAR